MTNSFRIFVVAVVVTAVAGCGKENSTGAGPSVDVLAQDTTLRLAPPVRPDQDLGPQDILAVATPASGTAEEPALASAQPVRKAPRRAGRSTATLASGATRSAQTRTASQESRASRRTVVASSVGRSGATRRQTPSTGRVVETTDVVADDMSPRAGRTTESATPIIPRTGRQAVVAAGSELALQAERRICTNTANVGDRFEAVLVEQVPGANGGVIPKGATAVAFVSAVQRDNAQSGGEIDIQIESITFDGRTYPLRSKVTDTELDKVRSNSRGSDLARVAAGTMLGAGMGRVMGRNTRSTVIGAASGAAAGAVLASRSQTVNTCVPTGGRITAQLVEPLTVGAAE